MPVNMFVSKIGLSQEGGVVWDLVVVVLLLLNCRN